MTSTFFEKRASWGIGHLVEDVPGNHHRHYDGLARTRCHLAAPTQEGPAVTWDLNAHPLGRRRLGQPNERLCRLQLAKEKATSVELLGVMPVLQEPLGDGGNAGIACLAPRL
jgi:hypothetical protein